MGAQPGDDLALAGEPHDLVGQFAVEFGEHVPGILVLVQQGRDAFQRDPERR